MNKWALESIAILSLSASVAFAQSSLQHATVTVDTSHVENRVSPRMYAAFAEMMAEDVKWGLTAEMVHDRSFEESPNYLGLPADWRLEPDTRNDNVAAIQFQQTTAEAYPKVDSIENKPGHSLRIAVASGDLTDARRGLSQGSISVVAGKPYSGYVWIRIPEKDGYAGEITAGLEEDNTDGPAYAITKLQPAQGNHEWQQYKFQLTPNKTDRLAKLSFLFPGKGVLYLDQVSLEPAAAKSEVRPDSEAMIAELHPSFLRWPGGNVAQDYHWQWGIGPRDLRPVWANKAWSNAPEPNDFGTDEYLAFCERLHIEPSITVNVNGNGATPEEAAAWVEYVNGPATSKYGAMRAANGHPVPYHVTQWELGNEIFGDWVRGHVDAETYARAAVQYAKAMHAVDPSLKFIAVGEGIMPARDEWNSAVLRIAGPVIDYLAIHDYNSRSENASAANPRAEMMARTAEFEAGYLHTAELIRQLTPGRDIRQIVNEWNLFYDSATIQSMEGAVYTARMMNGFERDGGTVEATCISDILNGWIGGVIQASRDRVYGTGEFWALKMYSDRLGTERLRTKTISPELQPGTSAVDAIATRSSDGSKFYIKMSNADREHASSVEIKMDSHPAHSDGELTLLSSDNLQQRNSFAEPDRVVPQQKHIHCNDTCKVELPPDSVAVLTLRAK